MTDHQFSGPSRRHVLALSLAGITLTISACAQTKTAGAAVGTAISGMADLFDAATPHQVDITWAEADYKTMIAAYESGSDKTWISSDITIDGTLLQNVGVRLKGNSTLRALGGQQAGPDGAANTRPQGGAIPDGAAQNGGPQGGMGQPTAGQYGRPGGGVGGLAFADSLQISADEPASLPLLIRFDKFVAGTTYQGLTELALRPGSPVINEALALSLTAATGQTSQRYAYTTYSVNGSPTQTRLLLENPDEEYANQVAGGSSVLFKADSESSFTYQGDETKNYEDQFKQLNKKDSQDFTPAIKFLKWLQDADSDTFDAQLATWFDVASFAKYAATQNLLANADDMAGPGQNYYLSYDVTTKKLSVISWDLNLALTNNAAASPSDSLSMGGGKGGNALKSRFLASAVFNKIYQTAYRELFTQVLANGTATELLASITATIPVSDALTAADIAAKSAIVGTFVSKRGAALKSALAN
ncbi:CotH kinase family protein [Arthrobacter sp. HLT1-20]